MFVSLNYSSYSSFPPVIRNNFIWAISSGLLLAAWTKHHCQTALLNKEMSFGPRRSAKFRMDFVYVNSLINKILLFNN